MTPTINLPALYYVYPGARPLTGVVEPPVIEAQPISLDGDSSEQLDAKTPRGQITLDLTASQNHRGLQRHSTVMPFAVAEKKAPAESQSALTYSRNAILGENSQGPVGSLIDIYV